MFTSINRYNGIAHEFETREEAETFSTLSNRATGCAEYYTQAGNAADAFADWKEERYLNDEDCLHGHASTISYNERIQ